MYYRCRQFAASKPDVFCLVLGVAISGGLIGFEYSYEYSMECLRGAPLSVPTLLAMVINLFRLGHHYLAYEAAVWSILSAGAALILVAGWLRMRRLPCFNQTHQL